MATSANQQPFQSDGKSGSSRPIYWQRPLDLVTTAFFLLGTLVFSRFVFSSHGDWIVPVGLAVTFLWRFGVHKAEIFPWNLEMRKRDASFSWRQALVEGASFFVFMIAIFALQGKDAHSSGFAINLAAIGSVLLGVYGGWYSGNTAS
jgi:hypothetical protein